MGRLWTGKEATGMNERRDEEGKEGSVCVRRMVVGTSVGARRDGTESRRRS